MDGSVETQRRRGARLIGALTLLASLLATLLVVGPGTEPAQAQDEDVEVIEVWGLSEGIVDDPKVWRYRQSVDGDDLGSAGAADPDLNDVAWETRDTTWREIVGPSISNHFRKDFDLSDIGFEKFQIEEIRVRLRYDDAAVMYLNGVEVYRSIRGNLLPDFEAYPPYTCDEAGVCSGTDMPFDVPIPFGGLEAEYTRIPDPDLENLCERPDVSIDPDCELSPYGTKNPPAVPVDLLNPGVNTWAITTWNQSSGGNSGDAQFDHVFELVVDADAVTPANVVINETMASNDTAYLVNTDDDPELESPDWIELRNVDPDNPTDISGWTIADAGESWTFPAGTIVPAGGYLIVVANDDDDPTASPLETNFKLGSSGDELKLTTDEGVVADEVSWSDQFTDGSFGRPGDIGVPTYLESPTPGLANNVGPLTEAPPILRPFRDRMFNLGEVVDLDIDAFDPDGDDLTYSVSPLPDGVTFDEATGVFGGTADFTSDVVSIITVTDSDNDTDIQPFTWFAVDPAAGPSPIVLNEYNAVPMSGELDGGSPDGNGGDWFEFLVVEDQLDLRGYAIEFRQRDADSDELRSQVNLTFADRFELASVPAGTIITIAEDAGPDDLSFDAVDDWSINLEVSGFGVGDFFEIPVPLGTFNSTRRDQTVLIRDANGVLVTPLVGETDGWDAVNGGVGAGEVMNLCRSIDQGDTVDPIADYRDNGTTSSFGDANTCVYADPADPGNLITEMQDLGPLRASAVFEGEPGDVNCDGKADVVDSLLISAFEVGNLEDTGPCLLGNPGSGIAAANGDVNDDGRPAIVDALLIAQCSVGNPNLFCP